MVPLTTAQVEALEAIRGLWPKADILLVGALALGCHIDLSYRHTSDMDLAISIDVDGLLEISEGLHGWKQHPKMEHRFRSPSGEIIDVLPASPALLARGFVEWPSGVRMGLEGFDLAFESSVLVPLSDSLHLRVPSAPAITLLKMRSWVDRALVHGAPPSHGYPRRRRGGTLRARTQGESSSPSAQASSTISTRPIAPAHPGVQGRPHR